ncbi:MAG: hypothetical protein COY40_00595 [Alphaproteobacteria bacterium CG_4_10_14_0_8_um_filter_53_9]|nr:MAG: hypothetical protein COY40_00595 [Alphaproteobacteria bacterium CG_4_10_14_0_8_um_filter_53_9]
MTNFLRNLKIAAVLVIAGLVSACSTTGSSPSMVPHGTTATVAVEGGTTRCGSTYRAGSVKVEPARQGTCNLQLEEADLAAFGAAILEGGVKPSDQKIGWVRATFTGGAHSSTGGCETLRVGDRVWVPVYLNKFGKATYQAWSKVCGERPAGRHFTFATAGTATGTSVMPVTPTYINPTNVQPVLAVVKG